MNSLIIFVPILFLQTCFAPPVVQEKEQNEASMTGLEDVMEYHRYLKEVVNALESDSEFRSKLDKADEHDIRSGKIAEQLEFVSHHVRTKLDEIKRVELDRLRHLVEKEKELMGGELKDDPTHHLDHSNPHTFEIEDLKKLIAKTTQDLAEADKMRKDEFKQYELQKEFEKQDKLNHTNGEEKEKLEKFYKEQEEKHKKHEKLHEPGHKAQLEEVWQEQDQMQQEFDPKTFFMLHDMDSNGLWDQDEVKALFIKELDKMYNAGAPEDDIRERIEEMERMRETVFKEVDTNRDGFIDFKEFEAQTKRKAYEEDHGWNGIDEQRPYTDEELQQYMRMHQAQGLQPPYGNPNYPNAPPPPGYHQQVPQGYHPNAVPQYNHGQGPPHQVPYGGHLPDLNTNEVYPQKQQVPPNYNYQQQHPQGNFQQQQQQYQQPNHPGSYQQPQGGLQQPQGNFQQPQGNFQHPQGNFQRQQPQGNIQMKHPQGNVQSQYPQGNNQGQPQVNIQGQPQGNIQGQSQGNIQGQQQQGNIQNRQGNIQAQNQQGNIQTQNQQGNIQGQNSQGSIQGQPPQGNVQQQPPAQEQNPVQQQQQQNNIQQAQVYPQVKSV